jgi:hypothetical protein
VGEGQVQVGAMTRRLAPGFCIRGTTALKLRCRPGWHQHPTDSPQSLWISPRSREAWRAHRGTRAVCIRARVRVLSFSHRLTRHRRRRVRLGHSSFASKHRHRYPRRFSLTGSRSDSAFRSAQAAAAPDLNRIDVGHGGRRWMHIYAGGRTRCRSRVSVSARHDAEVCGLLVGDR